MSICQLPCPHSENLFTKGAHRVHHCGALKDTLCIDLNHHIKAGLHWITAI